MTRNETNSTKGKQVTRTKSGLTLLRVIKVYESTTGDAGAAAPSPGETTKMDKREAEQLKAQIYSEIADVLQEYEYGSGEIEEQLMRVGDFLRDAARRCSDRAAEGKGGA